MKKVSISRQHEVFMINIISNI